MSFGQWYVSRGRISRRTFWLHYVLPLAALSVLAVVSDIAAGFCDLESCTTGTSTSVLSMGPLELAVSLLTLVPSISSTVTRLHDRGHSAWWLLFSLLPVIGWIVLFVQTGFLRGDGGPNRYGPPPASGHAPLPAAGYPPSSWG